MRVIVFGASGGIGSRLLPLLLDAGHVVSVFLRPTSNREALQCIQCTNILGDAEDRASVDAAFHGHVFDAVISSVPLPRRQGPTDRS